MSSFSSPSRPFRIDEVNHQPEAEFVSNFGSVFENSAWVAEKTWPKRPFRSRSGLLAAMVATVREAGAEKHLALIHAHPDLAGRMAQQGLLTEASLQEQASAGLDKLSAPESKLLEGYNQEYKSRFGFPFVICARLNDQQSILSAFARRLQLSREAEIETALDEIEKIAELRLAQIIRD